jgi:thiamine-phosphate pyrophosphorylase
MDTMRDRIIDANLNRLAEGLRVVEDAARFGLDDAELARRLKALRHDSGELRRLLGCDRLAARDSIGDVGRERIPEPDRRAGWVELLGASFGRAAESLRVLEETAKLFRPEAARLAKAMRYQTYDLEKQLVPLFDRRLKAERLRGLYLLLTEPAVGYERLAELAVEAEVGAIQLREKCMESGRLLALARHLRSITRETNTLFFVNDRPDIARLAEADGVHLGQTDLSIAEAREIVGSRLLIGKSTHNPEQLAAAITDGADYVGIGPVFATQSKANADPVLGIARAAKMLRQAGTTPAVAIGGLNEETLPDLLGAGFSCYALISHVGASANPREVLKSLKKLEKAHLQSAAGGEKKTQKKLKKPS